jgi:hypothetical protein
MGLNGTEVNCIDVNTSETVTIIVIIINEDWIEGRVSCSKQPLCTQCD